MKLTLSAQNGPALAELRPPPVTDQAAAPGRRVRMRLPQYRGSALFHTLYLPPDYTPDRPWPVIFEYPGNGPFTSKWGDESSGMVESCNLGYGLTGGRHWIWVGLPFVAAGQRRHCLSWWGDADQTAAYCQEVVRDTVAHWRGDPERLALSGFSRGAIASSFIGLRDDTIAALWRGLIACSHFDGVTPWPYPGSDAESAQQRLRRLKGRPVLFCHEQTPPPAPDLFHSTCEFIRRSALDMQWTALPLPFYNHNNTWLLRDSPERRRAVEWFQAHMG